jgi:hypothetical protein
LCGIAGFVGPSDESLNEGNDSRPSGIGDRRKLGYNLIRTLADAKPVDFQPRS